MVETATLWLEQPSWELAQEQLGLKTAKEYKKEQCRNELYNK